MIAQNQINVQGKLANKADNRTVHISITLGGF